MAITRRAFLRTGIAGGAALAGIGAYGFFDRHRLTVTHAALRVPDLPPALEGVRVGILTDLHHSVLVSQQDVADAARLLMAQRPDLIALLGDYVSWADRRYVGSCAEALASLSAPAGVYAILGNHDDERTTTRALAARGIHVLADAWTEIEIGGGTVTVAGLRYWTKKERDIRRVLHGGRPPAILLAHDPRRLTEAALLGVPVLLSGHTHGGQIVLPVLGALAAEKFPVSEGSTSLGPTALFVSRGVGTVLVPVRLNCPPEVAVVTLQGVSR